MISFNLATYEYTDKRITLLAAVVLSLILILFAGYNYRAYEQSKVQSARVMDEVEKLRRNVSDIKKQIEEHRKGKEGAGGRRYAEKLSGKVAWLNEIIDRKSFSWSQLLYSLEEATPPRIAITAIKPLFSAKKIKVSGQAKDVAAVTTFVDSLQGRKYIKKSFLLKENIVAVEKIYEAVDFDIECEGDF